MPLYTKIHIFANLNERKLKKNAKIKVLKVNETNKIMQLLSLKMLGRKYDYSFL